MSESKAKNAALHALHILSRWRVVFAGWQLGTRDSQDPECNAIKDHRELSMVLRAELSAMTSLLIDKGVFSEDEWWAKVAECAADLSKQYEGRFPGFKACESGLNIDPKVAAQTTRGWKP